MAEKPQEGTVRMRRPSRPSGARLWSSVCAIVAGLALALPGVFAGTASANPTPQSASVASTSSSQTISAQALSDHECDSSEWHFVITQVDDESDAPASIHVAWANVDKADVPLDKFTGGVAHYATTANLDSAVVSATTEIYGTWSGQFNLSHGPCAVQTTSSSETSTSETSTSTSSSTTATSETTSTSSSTTLTTSTSETSTTTPTTSTSKTSTTPTTSTSKTTSSTKSTTPTKSSTSKTSTTTSTSYPTGSVSASGCLVPGTTTAHITYVARGLSNYDVYGMGHPGYYQGKFNIVSGFFGFSYQGKQLLAKGTTDAHGDAVVRFTADVAKNQKPTVFTLVPNPTGDNSKIDAQFPAIFFKFGVCTVPSTTHQSSSSTKPVPSTHKSTTSISLIPPTSSSEQSTTQSSSSTPAAPQTSTYHPGPGNTGDGDVMPTGSGFNMSLLAVGILLLIGGGLGVASLWQREKYGARP